jgi:hypothetical protein
MKPRKAQPPLGQSLRLLFFWKIVSQLSLQRSVDLPLLVRAALRLAASLFVFLLMLTAIHAQSAEGLLPDDQSPLVVEGLRESDVFGWGQSIVVRGEVRHGVMAFGGDVIVEGVVEGDVATIGGSVIERDGARIGGDVIVIGGSYRRSASSVRGRDPRRASIMFEGFQPELRNIMRHPASALSPQWSLAYLGSRVLAVSFWFLASLVLTGVAPGAISRAVTRFQLTNLRVAIIGFLGSILMTFGVVAGLSVLPTVIGALVGLTALIVLLLAYLFGRVSIQAATGQWLLRRYFPEKYRSESTALLTGTILWAILLSLPYIWPLVASGLLVASLGLALTARYRVDWKRP